MPFFERHFSVDEANAMLPELRVLLAEIKSARDKLVVDWEEAVPVLRVALSNGGSRSATAVVADLLRLNTLLRSIASRGVLIKDIDRGLVDFPHLREGREVFLCWEMGEDSVAFWHDLDTGYPGRQPID